MYLKAQSFLAIKEMEPWLIETRQKIHKNPELSEHEWQTQALIEQRLDELGIEHERYAETGIVAVLEGGIPSEDIRVVGIRADIDALPIKEIVESPYQSKNVGVMHACGHDAHTTILLGTLKYLKENQSSWSGKIKGFFSTG